jgi:hypothetical protein
VPAPGAPGKRETLVAREIVNRDRRYCRSCER